ncbi:MAG: putative replicase protein [Boldovirus faecadaptatum]|uniref:RNA-directed RNA polymerase n=1 Tax=Leviviridae sp. TaxID=2027243 RepID=A0ABY3SSU2_9VIRU|nr:MAG: putative replicase protein [Leviviridae sp.]
MTKCHATQGFKELSVCLLRDVHSFVPTTDQEVEKDISRLLSLVENRGIGFLTLTLPEAGKRFDRSLAEGRLTPLCLPGFRPIGGHVSPVIPAFLQGIWMRVFDEAGLLREDPCIPSIAALRQFFNCFKKARLDCDPNRITATLDDFYRVDASLRHPSLDWDGCRTDDRAHTALHLSDGAAEHDGFNWECYGISHGQPATPIVLLDAVQRALDCVASSLGTFCATDWKPKHGTGAVSDGRVGKFLKYDFPTWSDRLESVFHVAEFGFPNYMAWIDWLRGRRDGVPSAFSSEEAPSRLITVPKTMKGPRLIASEPTSNQFCQQAILRYLVERVAQSPLCKSISFNDQTNNQVAALTASRTGAMATIDLSSASDCVSKWLVERAFRSNRPLLEALMATRTSWLTDDISVPPRRTQLAKFTTMGAATTFPVQSIIYAGLAAGVICSMDGIEISEKNLMSIMSSVRVFGDDIIIPTRYAHTYIELLSYLGFEVNTNKTFLTGKFRESCGVDAYDGVDVTPKYILEMYDELRPSSVESVRESSNNLFEAGLWLTSERLLRTLPASIISKMPVVGHGSGFPGLTSFCGTSVSSLRRRWNDDLQRFEVRTVSISNEARRVKSKGSACLLQYFLEAPQPDSMVTWSSGYDERPRLRVKTRWVEENQLYN